MSMTAGWTQAGAGGANRDHAGRAMRRGPAATARDWAAALTPIALIFAQLALLGADSGFLAAWAAVADLLALAGLAAVCRPGRAVFRAVAPALVLGLAAAGWGLAVRTSSIAPMRAPLEAGKLLALMALLVCGVLIGVSRARAALFCALTTAAGGFYTIGSAWLYEADPFRVLGVVKVTHAWRFTGALLNANVAGVVFGMLCLVALGWTQDLLRQRRPASARPLRIAGGAGTALIALVACGFTGSRMAFGGAMLLGAGLCLAGLARARAPVRGDRLPAAGVAGLIALAGALGVGPVLLREDSPADSLAGRLRAIHRFAALALQRPVTGWGLGAFDQVNQSTLTSTSAADMYDFGAAHSAPVQAFLEGGAPYLACLAAAGLLVGWRIAAQWRRMAEGWAQGLAAAVALALLCSLDDIDLNVPAVAGLAALLLGVLWGRAIVVQGRDKREARP